MDKKVKSSRTPKTVRSAKTGMFISIGRAKDGTAIARPAVQPRSFTVRDLERVVRDVQREESELKAG